jgi:hypothetical protein
MSNCTCPRHTSVENLGISRQHAVWVTNPCPQEAGLFLAISGYFSLLSAYCHFPFASDETEGSGREEGMLTCQMETGSGSRTSSHRLAFLRAQCLCKRRECNLGVGSKTSLKLSIVNAKYRNHSQVEPFDCGKLIPCGFDPSRSRNHGMNQQPSSYQRARR